MAGDVSSPSNHPRVDLVADFTVAVFPGVLFEGASRDDSVGFPGCLRRPVRRIKDLTGCEIPPFLSHEDFLNSLSEVNEYCPVCKLLRFSVGIGVNFAYYTMA